MAREVQAQIAERLNVISDELTSLKIEIADQSVRFNDIMQSITKLIGNENDSPEKGRGGREAFALPRLPEQASPAGPYQ